MEPVSDSKVRKRILSKGKSKKKDDDRIIEVNGKRQIIYQKLKFLGSGTFAKVFCCQRTDNKSKYAIKVISKKRLKGKPEIKNQVE
jgi:serine/threonine protein kinase